MGALSRKPRLVEIREIDREQIEERVRVLERLVIKAALRKTLRNKKDAIDKSSRCGP